MVRFNHLISSSVILKLSPFTALIIIAVSFVDESKLKRRFLLLLVNGFVARTLVAALLISMGVFRLLAILISVSSVSFLEISWKRVFIRETLVRMLK